MEYENLINRAVKYFWDVRISQKLANHTETTNRGAVLGGQQMNGFAEIMKQVAISVGVPENCIVTKGSNIPGYYRSSKNWDFLITAPNGKLITLIEFKSQIGSYGNNFNNRCEEAIGSSVDFWTAFRENLFPNQQAPWLGYLMLVGKDPASTCAIRNQGNLFPLLPEFNNASYIDRYHILCRKLVLERNYTAVALAWTSSDCSFGSVSEELSIEHFIQSFAGYLKGVIYEFQ